MAEPDPGSLAAGDPAAPAGRAGRRPRPPLQQAALRRQAAAKFGAGGGDHVLHPGRAGAGHPAGGRRPARRSGSLAAGVRRVVDLGCGIGADALAFVRAGLEVVAVERDPDTAAVAAANLAGSGRGGLRRRGGGGGRAAHPGRRGVLRPGPAERPRPGLAGHRLHARAGRWSPGCWTGGVRPGSSSARRCRTTWCPADAEAEWLTDRGDTVEVGLWAGPGSAPGRRSALVRAAGDWHRLVTEPDPPELPVREVGGYSVRAGRRGASGPAASASSARRWTPALLDPHLAYLTGDDPVPTPFATAYAVRDRAALRPQGAAALGGRARQVGRLEIKQRGTTVDPAGSAASCGPSGPERGHADRLPDPARRGGAGGRPGPTDPSP